MNYQKMTKKHLIEKIKNYQKQNEKLQEVIEKVKITNHITTESETKYRNLFDQSNDGIFLHDLNGNILNVNKKVLTLFEYTEDEILSLNIQDLHPESARETSKQAFQKIQKDGFVNFEINFKKKEGTIFPAEVSSSVFNVNGTKIIQGILRDITERKQAEKALQESELRYRSLFEHVPTALYRSSPDGQVLDVNSAFLDMIAVLDKESLLNRNASDFYLNQEHREQWKKLMEKTGVVKDFECQICRNDGKVIWIIENSRAVKDSYGKILYYEGSIDDITERKNAEKALQESELQYRMTLDSMGDMIHVIDRDLRFLITNTAFKKVNQELGFKADVSGLSVFEVFPFLPETVRQEYESVFESGEPLLTVERNKVADKVIITETRKIPITENNQVSRIVTVIKDITQQKASEESLRQKSQQQDELLEAARQLTSSLNLKEVLTRIGASAHKLLDAHGCAIYLLEGDGNTLTPVVAIDPQYEKQIMTTPIKVNHSFIGKAVLAKHGLVFNNAYDNTAKQKNSVTMEEKNERKIATPFIVEDKIFGAMCLNKFGVTFSDEELALAETLATYASTALKNAQAHQALQIEVDERSKVEQALLESQERFRTLYNKTPAMLHSVDGSRRIVNVSDYWLSILGYKREEVIGRDPIDFLTEESKLYAEKVTLPEYQISGVAKDIPYQFVKKDGEIIDVLLSSFAEFGEDGKILRTLTVLEDVSERNRAQRALQESKEKYQRFFEEDLTGDYITRRDGKIIACNRAFARIFGFKSIEEVMRINAKELFPSLKDRKKLLKLLKNKGKLEYHELELRRADGKPVYVICNLTGTFNDKGELEGIIGYIFDNTDRKMLEHQFRFSQKMEAIGRLAGGVAHDFNNLLTVINGYSDLLMAKVDENDPLSADLNQIQIAGKKAARLTEQLLTFSRRQMMKSKLLNLNTIVTEIDRMLRRLIGEDIELKTILSPSLDTIKADPGQIEQVIMNLAVNARDAMPRGGKLTIETSNIHLDESYVKNHMEIQMGDYIMLAVSDNGIGMDDDTQLHVFEPFFTTKEAGKGTGLGLSTVYGIVKQSNGYIWVYSEKNKGTTFKIYFPKVKREADKIKKRSKSTDLYHGSETILVVEDEPMVLELTNRMLNDHGYKVIKSDHGYSAINLCKAYEGQIHLLLTDLVMPDINGSELAKKIKLLIPDIEILYMSGYTDNTLFHQGVVDEEITIIQKPFTRQMLLSKIRKMLDNN